MDVGPRSYPLSSLKDYVWMSFPRSQRRVYGSKAPKMPFQVLLLAPYLFFELSTDLAVDFGEGIRVRSSDSLLHFPQRQGHLIKDMSALGHLW